MESTLWRNATIHEVRHSHAAQMLADHYDVHRYRTYRPSKSLERFYPHFVDAIRYLSDDVANAYITSGELILDVALLRSLDDYVDDEMSHQAMELINRDESRHIAIDFHMTEYYSSDEYLEILRSRKRPTPRQLASGIGALARMMWHARPFLQQVFIAPMDRTDPSGRRIKEAFKRIQLIMRKPTVARQPFSKFMLGTQALYNHPVAGKLFGPLLLRALGADDRAAKFLFTREELEKSQQMTFEELAEEAVAAKYS